MTSSESQVGARRIREDARSVPENAGRNGLYKTFLPCRWVVLSEAARFLGGQAYAPSEGMLHFSRSPPFEGTFFAKW